MSRIYKGLTGLKRVALGLSVLAAGGLQAQSVQTNTYSFTGSVQTFTVPSCVTQITITCLGAEGVGVGNFGYIPGKGGAAYGVFNSFGGQVLRIYVGGQNGYNGGGSGQNGGNGGGASDVRLNGTAFADRIIVAGGGGGAGGDNWGCNSAPGHGGGGTPVGSNFVGGGGGGGYTGCGTNGGNSGGIGASGCHGGGGGGGGFVGGGTGADATCGGGTAGTGSLGLGGNSAISTQGCNSEGAGGGGGGYYGGGGAAGTNCGAGRGGGGSSWTGNLANPSFTAGAKSGNGVVVISYLTPAPNVNTNNVIAAASNTAGICPGNSVTLNASNVTSYTWQPGNVQAPSLVVSPNVTSSYTVFGTNLSGCLSMSVLTVPVVAPPSLTVTNTNTFLCVGQTATLTAAGASTYSWTGSTGSIGNGTIVTVSPTTSQSFTISGGGGVGCVSTMVMPITVNSLSMTVSPSTVVCYGQTANFSASGTNNYLWSSGSPFQNISVTGTASTVYTVTGTDVNNCTLSNTVSLTVNPNPTVTASASKTLVCKGEVVTLNGTGAATYSWTGGLGAGATVTVSPALNTLYTYTVTGTDANGCTNKSSVTLDVKLCTGVEELTAGNAAINIYPNPSNGSFTIRSSAAVDLYIVNEIGQTVKTVKVSGTAPSEISGLADGIYFIKGESTQGRINHKVVVLK